MGHGPWAMGHGPWAMDDGPWAMGHGRWAMGHGPWTMGHGPWAMDDGPWAMDCSHRVAAVLAPREAPTSPVAAAAPTPSCYAVAWQEKHPLHTNPSVVRKAAVCCLCRATTTRHLDEGLDDMPGKQALKTSVCCSGVHTPLVHPSHTLATCSCYLPETLCASCDSLQTLVALQWGLRYYCALVHSMSSDSAECSSYTVFVTL